MILNPSKLNSLFKSTKINDVQQPINFTFSLFSPHLSNFTKDFAASTLKSLLFLKIKPYKCGEYVRVCGYEGRIESTDVFYVKLKRKDKSLVYLPTCNMLNTIIEIIK
ncbi:hypothetical protein BDAP_001269 [Binucleata daphniae]